jgi:hypothetical protein
MCKERPVIPVNRVVDPKRIIGKNGVPRRKRGTRGRCLPPPKVQHSGLVHFKSKKFFYLPTL